jgi:hypothetical protein
MSQLRTSFLFNFARRLVSIGAAIFRIVVQTDQGK